MKTRPVGLRAVKSSDAGVVIGLAAIVVWLSIVAALIAAWITHVIVCIKAAAWILLLFGCVVAPVGVIHGIGVWIGVF